MFLLQINLSEYRNRARKPADRKSSTEVTPSTPSHITQPLHYHILPPPPVAMITGMPPGIVMETNVPLMSPGVAVTMGGGMPQFEPVSPDDNDSAPINIVGGVSLMNRELPLIAQQPVYVINVCIVTLNLRWNRSII